MKTFTSEPKAFISWSLFSEDEPFIQFIEKLTRDFGFETFRPVNLGEESPKSLKEQIIAGSYLADCTLIAGTPSYLCCLCEERNIGWKEVLEGLTGDFHPILAFLSPDLHAERGIHPMIQSITLNLRNPEDVRLKYPLLQYLFDTIQQMVRQRGNRDKSQEWLKDIENRNWKRYCN